MQNFIRPYILGSEMWVKAIGHLKILDVQLHMLPNFKFYMTLCFIGMLLILFWTCSKSFLAWVYNFSHPLTISTISLEWSFHPMGPLVSQLPFPTLIQTKTFLSSSALWICNKTLLGLDVHPTLFDDIHIINKVLVRHLIDPFYLAISLWMECHIKRQIYPHLRKQMLLEACYKFGILIINNELRYSMMPNPNVKKQFC